MISGKIETDFKYIFLTLQHESDSTTEINQMGKKELSGRLQEFEKKTLYCPYKYC